MPNLMHVSGTLHTFFGFSSSKSNILVFLIWMQAVPCAALALFIHPSTSHHVVNRILWAFCVYLEAVSVLPQLRVMQNTKVQVFMRFFHRNRYYSFKLSSIM
jgi:hypothetical protein